MIREGEKREHKMQGYTFCIVVCKQMHVMDFLVLITALLPFLMELKMKGKRNKQLSKKEVSHIEVFNSIRRKKEHGIATYLRGIY